MQQLHPLHRLIGLVAAMIVVASLAIAHAMEAAAVAALLTAIVAAISEPAVRRRREAEAEDSPSSDG